MAVRRLDFAMQGKILEMQIPVASWSELKYAGLLPENAPTPRAQHKTRKALMWQASPGQSTRRRERYPLEDLKGETPCPPIRMSKSRG